MQETYRLIFTLESDDHTQLDLIEQDLNEVKDQVLFNLIQQARRVVGLLERDSRAPSMTQINPALLYTQEQVDTLVNNAVGVAVKELYDELSVAGQPDVPSLSAALGIPDDEIQYMLDPETEGQVDGDDKWDIEIDPAKVVPIVAPNMATHNTVRGPAKPPARKPAPKRVPSKKSATTRAINTKRGI